MAKVPFTSADIQVWQRERLSHLKPQGSELRGTCPVHGGDNPTAFSFNPETGEAFCHSGCNRGWGLVGLEAALTGATTVEAMQTICSLVGKPVLNGKGGGQLIEIESYRYTDENGVVLFQQVRYWDTARAVKTFKARRPGRNGEWVHDLKNVRRVLYRLPQVLKAELVFVVEGEKDVHSLESLGLTATTNPLGAGKWLDDHSDSLIAGMGVF